MRAIVFDHFGDESVMKMGEVEAPVLGPRDLRIRVHTTALNRADLLQRQGLYPPPPGASPILGMECAGEVIAMGREVSGWRAGDRAMALLPGGGYAEQAVGHHGSAMPVPPGPSDDEEGARAELDLAAVLRRHLRIIGSTLRTRSVEEKPRIVDAFINRFGAALDSGSVRPTVDCVLPMAQVAEAHRRMQASAHFGKIVL